MDEKITYSKVDEGRTVLLKNSSCFGQVDKESDAIAIVNAYNSHYELIKIIKHLRSTIQAVHDEFSDTENAICSDDLKMIDDAIKKVDFLKEDK